MVRILSASLAALALLAGLASAGLLIPEELSQQHIGPPAQAASEPLQPPPTGELIGTPAQHPAEQHLVPPPSGERIGTPAQPHSHKLERRRRHRSNSATRIPHGKVTFYGGAQLLNPACPGARTPNDGSMIAAISFDSPFECGDKIKITDSDGKSVVVTAVDRCAGCTRDWIDVTKGVFQVFSALGTGVLRDVSFTKI